jgi:hypothetical protein
MERIARTLIPITALAFAACASSSQSGKGSQASNRTGVAAPAWFEKPPKNPRSLFFVGDASGLSDEAAARDAARNKALSELTNYCGASIKSVGSTNQQEINGKLESVVSLSVDVAGDEITVREAVVKEIVSGKGSDGTFDAFVLLEWPRGQYDAVLAAQKQRASRALAVFLEADSAAKNLETLTAKTKIKEAKAILGPMKSQVPLDHPDYKNSALLWDAISALADRLDNADKERKGVFAVAVECIREGKPTSCNPARAGTLRTAVAKTGRKISTESIPAEVTRGILSSENPSTDKAVRSAGFVVAVRYTADLQGTDGPFTFVRAGARGVVYDTSTNRVVSVQEIPAEKEGHPSFDGAMEKGFNNAEKQLLHWIEEQIPKIK